MKPPLQTLPRPGVAPIATALRVLPLLVLVGLPGWVGAQESVGVLAPPGECARTRASGVGLVDPEFSIAGPVAALLDPIDVAGSLPPAHRPPPSAVGIPRPGPCDRPASGCNPSASVTGGPPRPMPVPPNPPIQPGDRPAPNPPISSGSRPPAPGSMP